MVYKSFIRPQMEYGLQLMPKNMVLIKVLEKAQRRFLTSMLSVSGKSNQHSVRVLYHLQDMQRRHEELSCAWACRFPFKDTDHFLVNYAKQVSLQHNKKSSCFFYIHSSNNQLLEECRNKGIIGFHGWKKQYECIRLQYRTRKLVDDRSKATHPNALRVCDDGRAHQMYHLGRQPRDVRRLITLYLLGRIVSIPRTCLKCAMPKCGTTHMLTCSGIDSSCLDNLILRGRLVEAKNLLMTGIRTCLTGRPILEELDLDPG
jgi:hypothetical protein